MGHRLLTCLAFIGWVLLFTIGVVLILAETPFVPFEYVLFGRNKVCFAYRICDWVYDNLMDLEF